MGDGFHGLWLRLSDHVAKSTWDITMRILQRVLRRLPPPQLENFLYHSIAGHTKRLPAAEALRFLFRLDAALYRLQGAKAVEYDGGIHTKHRHTGYHDFFVSRIHPGERVLDVGCGIGALAYDVADRAGAKVMAVDLKEERIYRARQRYAHPRVTYIVGDVLEHIPGESFDVAVLSNILEHIDERPIFLRRLWQLAAPHRLLIRVPLYERDWRVPLKEELGVEWRLDRTHKTEYTLDSFAGEMAEAGLRIAHQEVRWGELWAEVLPDGT